MKSDIITWPKGENGNWIEEKYCGEPGSSCGVIFLLPTARRDAAVHPESEAKADRPEANAPQLFPEQLDQRSSEPTVGRILMKPLVPIDFDVVWPQRYRRP
jgi:hypothetical protein